MKKFEDGSLRSTGVLVKQKPKNAAKLAAAEIVESAAATPPRAGDAQLQQDLDELHRRQHADHLQD